MGERYAGALELEYREVGHVSVELRWDDTNELVCDWGMIIHSDPRPERGQVGALMLTTTDYVQTLITSGPKINDDVVHSVTVDGDRIFAHINYFDKHWCWELFDARWWDDFEIGRWLVGRWPD